MFLAFPAIFPASATLIEKQEKQKKEKVGLEGQSRGAEAASIDAAGAAMGSIGLLVFALVVWKFVTNHSAWLVLSATTFVWLTGTTAACKGHSGCVVWQQFIYATDYAVEGEAAVFMQYWLIGWGSSACPSGFGSDGAGDCYGNSNYVSAPDVKPTSLGSLSLSGAAAAGGSDTVALTDGSIAYRVSGSDSVLEISQV